MDATTIKAIVLVVVLSIAFAFGWVSFKQPRRIDLIVSGGAIIAIIALELMDQSGLSTLVLIIFTLWLGYRRSGWRQL